MKKILFILAAIGGLFTSCDKDADILAVKEYIAVQPASFGSSVTTLDSEVTIEFKLTNFDPKEYIFSSVQQDADEFITGTTEILRVDISSEGATATITGAFDKSVVNYADNSVGAESDQMFRLELSSQEGNSSVVEPWLYMAAIESAVSTTVAGDGITETEIVAGDTGNTLDYEIISTDAATSVSYTAYYKSDSDDSITDIVSDIAVDLSSGSIDPITDIIVPNSDVTYIVNDSKLIIELTALNTYGTETVVIDLGVIAL